ncbi:MAG: hypothetical protein R2876_06190 [Eubacteriales bacterium]
MSVDLNYYLKDILNDKVKNAYLLICEKQSETLNLSREFLLKLFCKNKTGCKECALCRRVLSNNHPDIMNITPKGKTVRIDDVREAISFASLKAYEGGYKAVVINNAELLSEGAQNCLLKVIEEPPQKTVFLLLARTKKSILPTVMSRAATIIVNPIDKSELRDILIREFDISTLKASLIANLSGGYLNEAKNIVKDEEFFSVRDISIAIARSICEAKGMPVTRISDKMLKQKEDLSLIINCLISYFSDILMFKITSSVDSIVNSDLVRDIKIRADGFTRGALSNIIDILIEAENNTHIPLNLKLQTQAMLFNILEEKNK